MQPPVEIVNFQENGDGQVSAIVCACDARALSAGGAARGFSVRECPAGTSLPTRDGGQTTTRTPYIVAIPTGRHRAAVQHAAASAVLCAGVCVVILGFILRALP